MRSRGMSLLELMVTLFLLSLMMVATAFIMRESLAVRNKGEATNSAFRAILVGMEHLRAELRGGQVLGPGAIGGTPVNRLTYRFPAVRPTGLMVVDGEGIPVWAGTATVSVNPQGRLVRVEEARPTEERVLADLGQGSFQVERVALRILRVNLVAVHTEMNRETSTYRLSADIELPNNE
ncbi:MAG: type II secretion system protein [Candidatus Eremiobacterota bacterium]